MSRKELNLGILAHVDAGKTSLTERLLYETGVLDEPGSVDVGTTQTDSLALERQRGITIRSAVAAFALADVHVNLIDTPGHPDFIAEVERVLGVLDGAILVVSSVEGVQPQTRILMRALQRLRIPTLLFVNKIDRLGADPDRVLREVSDRLTSRIVPLGAVGAPGTRAASFGAFAASDAGFRDEVSELLADRDAAILAAYVEDEAPVPYRRLRSALAEQVRQAAVHPVFFGSAITGAGVDALMAGMVELLPVAEGDENGPLSASVFKIERGAHGEKVAYVRLFSGTIRIRDRLHYDVDRDDKVTAIAVFEHGGPVQRRSVSAGAVAELWGLRDVQIGDRIGERGSVQVQGQFPPPTLESVVQTRNREDGARLRIALGQLAEQDPLINIRQDTRSGDISVSLYGEVQKEVIQATLAGDFGLEATFRETTPVYVERPTRAGEAVELLHAESNPFLATIGFRIEPSAPESGLEFRLQVDHSSVPLYLYKTAEGFAARMEEYVRQTLQEGLHGWQVTDCTVTMITCSYSIPDGPPSRRGPPSTAADFRKLTPLVLMQALQHAGTTVCEPTVRATIEIPLDAIGGVVAALGRLGATVEIPAVHRALPTVETVIPALRASDLERQLPGLTGGEGVLESSFGGYQPVLGDPPRRARTTADPLNLGEYMMQLARRATRPGSRRSEAEE